MTESKADQIKRLQGNLARFGRLPEKDQNLIMDVGRTNLLFLHPRGEWIVPDLQCCHDLVYQICKGYKPEPETPKFEGYVLCEVKWNAHHKAFMFRWHGDDELHTVGDCPNLGCCGYVFKELPDRRFNSPLLYAHELTAYNICCYKDAHSLTLGWVAFKKEVE